MASMRTRRFRASITDHLAQLEQRFGRVTACRVVLKGPGGHHRTGGLYEVHIRLALPNGREVNVERTAQADERHSDLTFAITDAFKRARRRLQDQAHRLQGLVKHHDSQSIGTVLRLDPEGRFGFLEFGRWPRDLFPSQQRARRWVFPFGRWLTVDVYRGDRREGSAGEHREAARQAPAASVTSGAQWGPSRQEHKCDHLERVRADRMRL